MPAQPDAAPQDPPAGASPAALLYGRDPSPGIVAVEVDGTEAAILSRRGGELTRETRPFRPWLAAAASHRLPGAEWTRLSGEGHVWRADFAGWPAAEEGRETLRQAGVPVAWYGSRVKQFLIATGMTLFKSMRFEDLHRLQLDLETTGLRPESADARILLVSLSDNRGFRQVLFNEDEAAMLRELVALVGSLDPDTIEGHNLYGFDLPYLAARAASLNLSLDFGRDDSPLRIGRERNYAAGPTVQSFRPAHIWGRHCIDTLLAVQRFDVGRGQLESYGLKECARELGLAEPDRILLDRSRMAELWREDPGRVARYGLQDVIETERLAALVTPTDFYQTQMVPDAYESVATAGMGEKINSLLVREYLAEGCAIPLASEPRPFAGGYTEVRRTGVLRQIVKVDVESLYPSLMLQRAIRPAKDVLDAFLPMLRQLTERRLAAKSAARAGSPEAGGSDSAAYWEGLQQSFKILINSFYGYLGGPFYWNDFDAAERVTLDGQQVARQIAAMLEETGSQVIEIDTDGVYFVPPPECAGPAEEERYVESLAGRMPAGLRLAYDGRYQAMLSLKIKNYALRRYEGGTIFRGSALRSRADERFGREFIAAAVDCLFREDPAALAAAYADVAARLLRGQVPVEQLARRERITGKTLNTATRRRQRAALGPLRVGESVRVYRRADGSLARIEDYAGDEDRAYYLDKLHKFAARLEEAIGPEFLRLCPLPSSQEAQQRAAGQGSLFDL